MNKLDLRTLIHKGLAQNYGTHYGEVLTVEPLNATPADPEWSLLVTVPDLPPGDVRKFRVTITEVEE